MNITRTWRRRTDLIDKEEQWLSESTMFLCQEAVSSLLLLQDSLLALPQVEDVVTVLLKTSARRRHSKEGRESDPIYLVVPLLTNLPASLWRLLVWAASQELQLGSSPPARKLFDFPDSQWNICGNRTSLSAPANGKTAEKIDRLTSIYSTSSLTFFSMACRTSTSNHLNCK